MVFSPEETKRLSLNRGDLLVCEGGDIGRTAVWGGEVPDCSYQNHLHRLRPRSTDTCPEFFMYWLQAAFTLFGTYAGAGNKTTIPNLSRSRLASLAVPIPTIAEQRAIAEVLSNVQRAKEAAESVIVAAKELKKSLMRHLFTYGAVRVDAVERVRLTDTEFGSVPATWEKFRLDECATVQTGVAKGRKPSGGTLISVPYLRVANVQDGYLELTEIKQIELEEREFRRYSLKPGDVLLTEGGDFDKLGRGFIWEGQIPICVHQNHIFAVRPAPSRLLPKFLAFLVQSPYGKAYFLQVAHRTTHLACINSTKLKAFPVVVPDLGEQERIVRSLESVDEKVRSEERHSRAIQALFESLLDQLMSGLIRLAGPGQEGHGPEPAGTIAYGSSRR